MEVFDFTINMEWRAYECVFGAMGYYGYFTDATFN